MLMHEIKFEYYGETWSRSYLSWTIEVPRLTCLLGIKTRPSRWDVNTLAKSYSNSVLIAIFRTSTYEPETWLPPVHVVTWTYMNTHELHQGHLHPKLVVPRLTCDLGWNRSSAVGGEHSSKELFKQRANSYSEHLHMSPRQYEVL